MAESTGEKTQDATPHRRQQARDKGQVAYSQDLGSAALLVIGALLLISLGEKIVDLAGRIMKFQLENVGPLIVDHDTVVDVPDPAMVPDGNATLEGLITDWEKSRIDLFKFLESCGLEELQQTVSRHPVTGPLTVVECLRLIASHFNHHRRRIETAIEQIK